MKKRVLYINGDFLDEEKASLSPFNRGLLYGDGIFETMRGYKGRPFFLEEHYARLQKSAVFLKINLPFDVSELGAILDRLLELNSLADCDSRMRLNVIRGKGKGGLMPDPDAGVEVIVTAEGVTAGVERMQREGIKLVLISDFRIDSLSSLAQHKTFNYISGIMGLMEVNEHGGDEGLFLNNEGKVVEGVTSNIFIVKEDILITPPQSAGILPGITRGLVLKVAAGEGIAVKERDISKEDLFGADEIFITSSVREVVPVVSVDENVFKPGPVTRKIQESYRSKVISQET